MNPDEIIKGYRALIRRLGERIGIAGLEASEENRCQLVFDEIFAVTIDVVPEEGVLWLHGSPGGAPTGNASQTYRDLLASALFGKKTLGVHVALDEASNSLILQRDLPLHNLAYEDFEKAVTNFVNALEHWHKRLSRPNAPNAPNAPGDSSMEAPSHAVRA